MSNSNITELETKIAFLERHIEEQDRVMLGLGKQLDKQGAQIKELQALSQQSQKGGSPPPIVDEKPPHY